MPGAVIAGFALGLIEVFVVAHLGASWRDAVSFAALFLILVLRPRGLLGAADAPRGVSAHGGAASRTSTLTYQSTSPTSASTRCSRSPCTPRSPAASSRSSSAGFMAIGAYAAALLTMHARRCPSRSRSPRASLLPALVAVPLGLPVLRLKGVFLAIATIGFGEVVRLGFVNWDYVNGAQGIVAIPQKTSIWMIYLALAVALFVLLAARAARKLGLRARGHPRGRAGGAHHGDPDRRATSSPCWCWAPRCAGLAGALEAHFTFMVAPNGFSLRRAWSTCWSSRWWAAPQVFWGPVVGADLPHRCSPRCCARSRRWSGIEPGPLRLW